MGEEDRVERAEGVEEMVETMEGRIVEEGGIETTVARMGAVEVAVILRGKASSVSCRSLPFSRVDES